MRATKIEWTDSTWNPLRGCTRVSDGCRNCCSERVATIFCGSGMPYEGFAEMQNGRPHWTGKVELVENKLIDPLKWRLVNEHTPNCDRLKGSGEGRQCKMMGCYLGRQRRIFVNSMSDLFHEYVPHEWIDKIFSVMAECPQHVFQVLTKRPKRMLEYISDPDTPRRIEKYFKAYGTEREGYCEWPLDNVWLGVSVESQASADERIPLLLQDHAVVRFVSCEPMLGDIDVRKWLGFQHEDHIGVVNADQTSSYGAKFMHDPWVRGLDWVICGGESGPGARPMHPDWVRSLLDQCQHASVPFFFKQWGEWIEVEREWTGDPFSPRMVRKGDAFVAPCGEYDILGADLCSMYEATALPMRRIGKKTAGRLLDGREWNEFPREKRVEA